MDTIQALIKHYIESNGYTVYSISQQSGLNRTTLQKILSGQRKITKEIYLHITKKKQEQENSKIKEIQLLAK